LWGECFEDVVNFIGYLFDVLVLVEEEYGHVGFWGLWVRFVIETVVDCDGNGAFVVFIIDKK
jgi:hypothetical protein